MSCAISSWTQVVKKKSYLTPVYMKWGFDKGMSVCADRWIVHTNAYNMNVCTRGQRKLLKCVKTNRTIKQNYFYWIFFPEDCVISVLKLTQIWNVILIHFHQFYIFVSAQECVIPHTSLWNSLKEHLNCFWFFFYLTLAFLKNERQQEKDSQTEWQHTTKFFLSFCIIYIMSEHLCIFKFYHQYIVHNTLIIKQSLKLLSLHMKLINKMLIVYKYITEAMRIMKMKRWGEYLSRLRIEQNAA